MNKFDFYKEFYIKENERRQEVLNSFNIPIAIITALSSATYFFITSFDYKIEVFLTAIFIGLISITIVGLLLAIYYLIRAFSDFTKGYEYSGLPYMKELYDWNKNLEEYYEHYENDSGIADKKYEEYLIEKMVEHTEHNMYVNDKKHGFIYKSKKFLIASLVLTLITLIPFGYNYFNKSDKIHHVELIGSKKVENKQEEIIQKLNYIIDSLKTDKNERQRKGAEKTDSTTTATTKGQAN
ncbi:hypothetical protein [Crocinitomix algicola]|uniref:hypothetical protein n=1 Tax=Crocinitomix algicola TaxID=1740263 RepID=UPI00083752AE|nr:hypothetical protein [Crocinitomix algicola]